MTCSKRKKHENVQSISESLTPSIRSKGTDRTPSRHTVSLQSCRVNVLRRLLIVLFCLFRKNVTDAIYPTLSSNMLQAHTGERRSSKDDDIDMFDDILLDEAEERRNISMDADRSTTEIKTTVPEPSLNATYVQQRTSFSEPKKQAENRESMRRSEASGVVLLMGADEQLTVSFF